VQKLPEDKPLLGTYFSNQLIPRLVNPPAIFRTLKELFSGGKTVNYSPRSEGLCSGRNNEERNIVPKKIVLTLFQFFKELDFFPLQFSKERMK